MIYEDTGQDLSQLQRTLESAVAHRRFNRMLFFQPYPKQEAFFDLGLLKRERMLLAGNQVGKTEAGAFEAACHITGDYPDWWMGRRFNHPTIGWICGETAELVRDNQQSKLCGEPGIEEDFGTGYIPGDRFIGRPLLSRGASNAFDTIHIEHRTNGIKDGTSVAVFKSYVQGRTKFQGKSIDWGWLDEEPDMDVYSETLTRVTATGGFVFVTFTPLKGKTPLVTRYLEEASIDRATVTMTIDEAPHMTPEKKRAALAGYPTHEREARAMGIPMMGEGRIFGFPDSLISLPGITNVPQHWRKIWGIDFGIAVDHPFAASLLLFDENDIMHVHHVIKIVGGLPLQHAFAMRQIASGVPVAWPNDGLKTQPGSGEQLAQLYRKHDLIMLPEHATFIDGGMQVEPGLTELNERARVGKWKVASHLTDVFDELHFYHRKNGLVVREKDDVLSSIRYGMMMRRYARSVPLGRGGNRARGNGPLMAEGIDFDL